MTAEKRTLSSIEEVGMFVVHSHGHYGWIGQQRSSVFFDIARPALGVFASLDRF
jgi:hypothetical protein